LGIPKLVVPLGDLASGWSAFGVAASDALVVQEAPIVLAAPFDHALMNAAWRELERGVTRQLEQQGIAGEGVVWERAVDIRYGLQVSELTIPAPPGTYDAATVASLVESFEQEYERLFGQGSGYAAAGFTLTSMRVSARARISEIELGAAHGVAAGDGHPSARPERAVIWYERGLEPTPTPVIDGAAMSHTGALRGPAIVEFVDTTLVLRHEQTAVVDPLGSIVIEVFA
jgi:N-methylhydantoinase A